MNITDEKILAGIDDEAAEWFVMNQSGEMDERLKSDFLAWLRRSPQHMAEYLAIAAISLDMPDAASRSDLTADMLVEAAREPDTGRRCDARNGYQSVRSRWAMLLDRRVLVRGVTTVVVLAVLVALLRMTLLAPDSSPTRYVTGHGQQQSWALIDGSIITLNSESEVLVRYSAQSRLVDIARGQAFFKVASGDARPFGALIGKVEVVAIGTGFDIYRRPDDLTVLTVTEGQVMVHAGDRGSAAAIRVAANQQLQIRAGAAIAAPTMVDAYASAAWLRRQIVLDHSRLKDLVQEFNRYSPVAITIDDPRVGNIEVSGTFDAYDTETLIQFIASLDGVAIDRSTTAIRVVARSTAPKK